MYSTISSNQKILPHSCIECSPGSTGTNTPNVFSFQWSGERKTAAIATPRWDTKWNKGMHYMLPNGRIQLWDGNATNLFQRPARYSR